MLPPKTKQRHTPTSHASVREAAVAPHAGVGVEQVAEVVQLLQARGVLLRRRHSEVMAVASCLLPVRPPPGLLLRPGVLAATCEGRPRPLRLWLLRRRGGRRLAGEPLHDVLEAGGVGADELRLDELDLHVVVLPAGAIDRHGHASRSLLSGTQRSL
jgi:hypothetical protein